MKFPWVHPACCGNIQLINGQVEFFKWYYLKSCRGWSHENGWSYKILSKLFKRPFYNISFEMNMPNRLNLKISSKSKFSLLKSSKLKKQARARLCLLLSQSRVIFNINSADENIEYKCLGKLFYNFYYNSVISIFLS